MGKQGLPERVPELTARLYLASISSTDPSGSRTSHVASTIDWTGQYSEFCVVAKDPALGLLSGPMPEEVEQRILPAVRVKDEQVGVSCKAGRRDASGDKAKMQSAAKVWGVATASSTRVPNDFAGLAVQPTCRNVTA